MSSPGRSGTGFSPVSAAVLLVKPSRSGEPEILTGRAYTAVPAPSSGTPDRAERSFAPSGSGELVEGGAHSVLWVSESSWVGRPDRGGLEGSESLVPVAGVPWGGASTPPGTSPHDAFALDVDLAAFFQHERILEARMDVSQYLNLAIGARRFHSRRYFHRIAPNRGRILACRRRRPPRGRCPAHPDRHDASMRILEVSRGLLHVEGKLAPALSPATTGQPER